MPKSVKIQYKFVGPSARGSEFNHSSEGPLQGAKMSVRDIHEFIDIIRPAPNWSNGVVPPPSPGDLPPFPYIPKISAKI